MKSIQSTVKNISLILLVALAGCGQSTIDATTDKTFSSTLIQVRSSVKEADLKLFDETIELALKDIKYIKESEKEGYKWALKRSKSLANIHGLTSVQIVSLGNVREKEAKEAEKLRLSKRKVDLEKLLLDYKEKLEHEQVKVNKIKITNITISYELQPSSNCEVKSYLCEKLIIEFDIINESNDILFDLSVFGYIRLSQDINLSFSETGLLSNGLSPAGIMRVKSEETISLANNTIDVKDEIIKANPKVEVNIGDIDFIKPFNKDKLKYYILEHEQNKAELIKLEKDEKDIKLNRSKDQYLSLFKNSNRRSELRNLISSRNQRIKTALVYQSASPYGAKNNVEYYTNKLQRLKVIAP
jgi:hypothetical protein